MIHQLRNIIDAHYLRHCDAAIWKLDHLKVRRIGRRSCCFKLLHQIMHSFLESIKAKGMKTFHRFALRISIIANHNRIHQFGKYSDSFCMSTPECRIIL